MSESLAVDQKFSNIERIREGLGDKLGLLIRGVAMLVGALIVAFIYEWRIAFIMLGVTPSTCVCMSIMARVSFPHGKRSGRKCLRRQARSSEEWGRQAPSQRKLFLVFAQCRPSMGRRSWSKGRRFSSTSGSRYEEALSSGKRFAIEKSFWGGFCGGLFYFILYSFLAAGFLFGGHLLVINSVTKPGDIFTVIFSMILGAYFLGLISPQLMVDAP